MAPREVVTLTLFKAVAQWLPQFAGKKLAPKPTISIPPGTVPAEVPLDPALVIAHRFGDLASK